MINVAATIVNIIVFYGESESSSQQIQTLVVKAEGIVGAMNQALSDNRNSISKAFEENESTLESSEKQSERSLSAAINNSHLDLRAWVGVQGVEWNRTSDWKQVNFEMKIRNSGRTPALKVQVFGHRLIDDRPLSKTLKDDLTTKAKVKSKGVTWPDTIGDPVDGREVLTDDDAKSVAQGRKWVYLYGVIVYRDVFSDSVVHHTRFCYRLEPNGSQNIPLNPSPPVHTCEQYNEAD